MNSINVISTKKTSKRFSNSHRSGFSKSGSRRTKILHRFWILGGVFYFAAGLTAAQAAEVSDLVINSTQDHLLVSVKIRDVIAGEVNASVAAEVSATIIFSIALYEVKPFWFDKNIAHHAATNTIKHHPEKNDYRLLRSWDSGPPLAVDSLNEARLLMAEVNNLKLMPLAGLEKGRDYQIRVQAVCQDKNAYIFSPSGCFKTDWHTVDFTF
jgi:hypothetical protein